MTSSPQPYGQLPLPSMSPYLMSLMKTGQVYDLGTVLNHDIPLWPGHPPFRVMPYKWHGDTADLGQPATLFNDFIMTCTHAGTHMDALTHIGATGDDGEIHLSGGRKASECREWWGCNHLDASQFHPILLRGVVLDMLSYKGGVDTGGEITLSRDTTITAEDIKGCMERFNIPVKPEVPTAFLIRTGFIKYFLARSDKYGGHNPGPDLEAQKYLASIGAVVGGSDTVSYEKMMVANYPVHRYMMENGYIITEVLDLEAVSAGGIYEGVYIALPLRWQGASGSLLSPIFIC